MKKCSRCEKTKPIDSFQVRRASKDGLTAACKECLSIYDRSRASLPHRVHARVNYQKTDRGKAAADRAKKKFIENNPIKRKAHNIVSNALRSGKLVRPEKCQQCSSNQKIFAHHTDYSQPLLIMWLCDSCHKDWHKHNTPKIPKLDSPTHATLFM
ncbi:hypothetical protein [Proteus genomosp. 6]|uniref:hypothetical protein n=1 Tax=Proteus genomosp. 6 TaxID=1311820 RepID=UPI001FC958E9|nr:hypothetical protein [Proteus genomosp. 6]